MRRKVWIVWGLLLTMKCYAACVLGIRTQQKAESTIPIPTNSPPEGNTTFIEGTTWCVARPGAAQWDLQNALDWACGTGSTDCSALQAGGPCFQPDTLLAHASYAFNSFYQQNGNSDIACNFGGTATITNRNPSFGSCNYTSSEPASALSLLHHGGLAWKILGILVTTYLNAGH